MASLWILVLERLSIGGSLVSERTELRTASTGRTLARIVTPYRACSAPGPLCAKAFLRVARLRAWNCPLIRARTYSTTEIHGLRSSRWDTASRARHSKAAWKSTSDRLTFAEAQGSLATCGILQSVWVSTYQSDLRSSLLHSTAPPTFREIEKRHSRCLCVSIARSGRIR